MSLSDLAKSSIQNEQRLAAQEERSALAFAHRLAGQQVLKHHAALLAAFAESGGVSGEIGVAGEFVERAKQARTLAIKITAYAAGKPESEVELADARHFRVEAAEVVARYWERGKALDLDAFAKEVAAVVVNADATYDADTIKWSKMTHSGSMALTALGVATALSASVELYDFRMGRRFVLSMLTSAVVDAARCAVGTMVHEAATDEDVRSLSQTTLRSFTGIMVSLYDRSAHACLSHLVTLPLESRSNWLSENAPLERIINDFRDWSDDVADIALMAADETLADVKARTHTPGA